MTPETLTPGDVTLAQLERIWRGGAAGEDGLLASCYRRSLELAAAHEVLSLAIPGISTGIYGYPITEAARIAVNTVRTALPAAAQLREVLFCCFSAADLAVYEALLADT